VPIDDGAGNTRGEWRQQFECSAEFRHQGGSESVQAARLEGRNLIGVYVRSSIASRSLTTDWRMRDVRRSTEYAIRLVDAVTDREFVYLQVEKGVAA